MSNTTRWILAILLMLSGIGLAAFVVFGGGISTIACQEIPPDWVYYILIASGLVAMTGGIVPAIMLIRRAKRSRILLALILALFLSCGGYATYFVTLGNNC